MHVAESACECALHASLHHYGSKGPRSLQAAPSPPLHPGRAACSRPLPWAPQRRPRRVPLGAADPPGLLSPEPLAGWRKGGSRKEGLSHDGADITGPLHGGWKKGAGDGGRKRNEGKMTCRRERRGPEGGALEQGQQNGGDTARRIDPLTYQAGHVRL